MATSSESVAHRRSSEPSRGWPRVTTASADARGAARDAPELAAPRRGRSLAAGRPTGTILPPPMQRGRTAISVEGVSKRFRVPTHRVNSFKERALHPFRMNTYHQLLALEDVTFEVREGEFFGIFGRNGSGKSTLLKLLASIYRADTGRIRLAGRLAPFIELGVGFNEELTARENAILNCVMMGFSVAESRRRLDDVIEFAELEQFRDLKLKNFSSGMRVRLAFSLLMQSDADVLLIDEVLAVGDASFQHKCHKAFQRLKQE